MEPVFVGESGWEVAAVSVAAGVVSSKGRTGIVSLLRTAVRALAGTTVSVQTTAAHDGLGTAGKKS